MKLREFLRFEKKRVNEFFSRSVNVPEGYSSSDLYIVEFPKSGITWLSTILLNYDFLLKESKLRASYFNLEQFVPDVHVNRRIGDYKLFDSYRLVKSHAEFNSNYRHMVYLIRNPWSVFSSYLIYLNENDHATFSADELLKSKIFGPKAWNRHVQGWLNPRNKQKLLLVRFEDLRLKASDILTNLLGNMGVRMDRTLLNNAIAMSDINEMKKSDASFRKMCPYKTYAFVRKGENQSGLSQATKEQIYDICRKTVEQIYSAEEIERFMKPQ